MTSGDSFQSSLSTALLTSGAAFCVGWLLSRRCLSQPFMPALSRTISKQGNSDCDAVDTPRLHEQAVASNEYMRHNSIDGNDDDEWNMISKPSSKVIIIGVGGASGSGKTSISTLISKRLPKGYKVVSISCDSYYKPLKHEDDPTRYNFDHPNAIDFDLLVEHLRDLKAGRPAAVPHYDFAIHQRTDQTTLIDDANVVIIDGIFTLHIDQIRQACDITLFTMEDMDVCLARRLRRDIAERGRNVESVIQQYLTFVKPGYETFIEPSMRHADLIVPRARDNKKAIDVIAREIERRARALPAE